jgi:hypothetical protein
MGKHKENVSKSEELRRLKCRFAFVAGFDTELEACGAAILAILLDDEPHVFIPLGAPKPTDDEKQRLLADEIAKWPEDKKARLRARAIRWLEEMVPPESPQDPA